MGLISVLSIIVLNSNYAQAGPVKNTNTVIIAGQVIDNATSRPISNAQVIVESRGILKSLFTDRRGNYVVYLSIPATLRPVPYKISTQATEYQKQIKFFFIARWRTTIRVDFRLKDIKAPSLKIYSPREGQKIFTNPTIRLLYSDRGSGINKATLQFFANGRRITGYIRKSNNRTALCLIPSSEPLTEGPCTLSATIRDFAGNVAEDTISVTVVAQESYLIGLGKKALLSKDILSSHNYFKQALNIAPNSAEANFYYSITRLATLPINNERIFNLLTDIGVRGQNGTPLTRADLNPSNFRAVLPQGLRGSNLAPTFPNTGIFQEILREVIIPELEGAIENLNLVLRAGSFVSYLEMKSPFTGMERIEIDSGDALLLKSIISLLKAYAHEGLVNNLDADLAQLSELFFQGILNPQYVLEQYPRLLRVENIPQSILSRDTFVLAIDSYLSGFNFIERETDEQSDDLVSISHTPEYRAKASAFNQQLTEVKKSLLSQNDSVFSMKFSQGINLGRLFTEPFDLRRMLDRDSLSYLLGDCVFPHLDYQINNFSKANTSYQEFLPPLNPFSDNIARKDIDFADISAMKLGLNYLRMTFASLLAYNFNLNTLEIIPPDISNWKLNFINNLINSHPDLLNLSNTAYLESFRSEFIASAYEYRETIDYLLNGEDANQLDDFLVPPAYFWLNESKYWAMLRELSNMQNTLIDPYPELIGDEFHLNLAEFFLNYKDLRQFLPQFDKDNRIIFGSYPEPTFGGVLPDNHN